MKNREKYLLFTFDYELFLGRRSGGVNSLIYPTDRVLDILDKYSIRSSIFFIDTLYLLRLLELKNEKSYRDIKQIEEQIVSILQRGHYIFPHIHSHWLDAQYLPDIHQWDLSNISKYQLHVIGYEKSRKLFAWSINYLKNIMDRAGVHHPIEGYRAGGWCIQPFSFFKPLFIEFGLRYEFSVLPNIKILHPYVNVDFTSVPEDDIYLYEDDVCYKDENGRFVEFKISSIEFNKLSILLNKILLKILFKVLRDRCFGNGESVALTSHVENKHTEMVSIELLTLVKLNRYIKYLDKNNMMHFISHPKMFTRHNLKMFEWFLSDIVRKYDIITDYKLILQKALIKQ